MLIEVLISSLLTSLILGALIFSFTVGFQLYRKISGELKQDALIYLEIQRMEKDLRNVFAFQGISFDGEPHRMAFPGLVNRARNGKENKPEVGRIGYSFDPQTKMLSREERGYAEALNLEATPHRPLQAIALIEDLSFSYLDIVPGTESYDWFSEWDAAGRVPSGVKIDMTVTEGGQQKIFTRFIPIPTAYES
jgi:hypothetical protein